MCVVDKTIEGISETSPGFTLYARTTNPYLRMTIQSNGAVHQASALTALPLNEWAWAVGTYDATRNAVNSWVNKTKNTETVDGRSQDPISNTRNVYIGARYNNGSNDLYWNGGRAFDIIFNTFLQDHQIIEIQNDPYQFLIPA